MHQLLSSHYQENCSVCLYCSQGLWISVCGRQQILMIRADWNMTTVKTVESPLKFYLLVKVKLYHHNSHKTFVFVQWYYNRISPILWNSPNISDFKMVLWIIAAKLAPPYELVELTRVSIQACSAYLMSWAWSFSTSEHFSKFTVVRFWVADLKIKRILARTNVWSVQQPVPLTLQTSCISGLRTIT